MPYCKKCGAELSVDAVFCPSCGTRVESVIGVTLTGWGERLVAWLIDMIIIGILLLPIKFFVWVAWPSFTWAPPFARWIPFVDLGLDNVIHFLYWTFLEGVGGQSIGKTFMRIKVTQLNGEPTDIVHAAIQSLGKAFLLPPDCIIGWILYPAKKQRLFNYISETIVIRRPSSS